jgi:putative DNA primase/helicase
VSEVLETALTALSAGISVLPIRADGSKAPAVGSWQRYNTERADEDQVRKWFESPGKGVAFICGEVSGNLQMFEFEEYGTYYEFRQVAESSGHGDLVKKLDSGYCERAPRGGIHWLYRVSTQPVTKRLAQRPPLPNEIALGQVGPKVLIETKGNGGYVIVAPSSGSVHPTGKPYEMLGGAIDTIPGLTVGEQAHLFGLAQTFDQMPLRHEPAPTPRAGPDPRAGSRPGDEWAKQTSWADILVPHGWKPAGSSRGTDHWCRPGKEKGVSASTGFSDADTLKVFSTSTIFSTETTYSRFGAWALLNHDGDFEAATKALIEQGFGSQRIEVGGSEIVIGPPPGDNGSPPAATAPAPPRDPNAYPFTDLGNAELFKDVFGYHWCFDHRRGKWMRWHEHWWQVDESIEVWEHAFATARLRQKAAAECADEERREAAEKFARQCENRKRIENQLKLATALPGMKVAGTKWDANPMLLGVKNGVIDLATGELRAGQRADYVTQHVPITYDPAALCPRFEQFLHEIMGGDAEKVGFLRRMIGYSMTGSVREQVLLMCHGRGSNGKTTLLNLLQWLMGDDPQTGYARVLSSRALQPSQGYSSQSDTLSVILGKRLVTASELSVRRFDEERLKAIAGGDIINTRFLRAEPFDFRPVAKLWLSFNLRPSVQDDSFGFWRKVFFLGFPVAFDRAAEPDLEDKLRAELPGILAFAVRAAQEWHHGGLKAPLSVHAATEQYREESDHLRQFLCDTVIRADGVKTSCKIVHNAYTMWCNDQGISDRERLSSNAFGRRMSELYERNRSSTTRYYAGLEIRSLFNQNSDAIDPNPS